LLSNFILCSVQEACYPLDRHARASFRKNRSDLIHDAEKFVLVSSIAIPHWQASN
jgi:hypothetical protein